MNFIESVKDFVMKFDAIKNTNNFPRIEEAIDGSSTGLEMFGRIGIVLREMKTADLDEPLKNEIDVLLRSIDVAFGR